MALEYVLYGSADLTTDEILPFMADAIGGTIQGDTARRDTLSVTAYREVPGDEAPAAELFSFTHRITATFRFSGKASVAERDRDTAVTIGAVLAFFDRYPGAGVLLFNDEEVVLQRLDGPVVLNSDWEGWTDLEDLSDLVSRRESRPLPQPLL